MVKKVYLIENTEKKYKHVVVLVDYCSVVLFILEINGVTGDVSAVTLWECLGLFSVPGICNWMRHDVVEFLKLVKFGESVVLVMLQLHQGGEDV